MVSQKEEQKSLREDNTEKTRKLEYQFRRCINSKNSRDKMEKKTRTKQITFKRPIIKMALYFSKATEKL